MIAARSCRPLKVEPCPACGAPTGQNYGRCAICTAAIDRVWLADWNALLEAEGISAGSEDEILLAQLVFAEYDKHPWTTVDWAMTLLRCGTCGSELGGGPTDCTECHLAFGNAIASEQAALPPGAVTPNDHALHIGRWVLRHPHRISENVGKGWRFTMPELLAGAALPSPQQATELLHLVTEGRHEEVRRLWEEVQRHPHWPKGWPKPPQP